MPASITRMAAFSAGHYYRRPDWSDAENERAFGASRFRHGHNYRVSVTVAGPIDAETGFIVDLGALDHALSELVSVLDQRDLTESIPEFAPGREIPSTEALARWFWLQLVGRVEPPAELTHVRVSESETLWADYTGELAGRGGDHS